ncbi:polysaccharide deacetylase [Mycobacterium sp. E136]|uniref:polysaccharide deacetylase family protein n=1 Tax=Mycobacterium sp. E136 TaxID=1834125 RepID=UPI0007FBE8EB|nr:polysaccharide deacetylase family protein [Mycobacterium sp. E136]OBG83703.1 polysaccharide deacetylase [Mycobacterium sp. E136]
MAVIGRYRTVRAGLELNRRNFIAALSIATVGAVGLSRCTTDGQPQVTGVAAETPDPVGLLPPPPKSARVALPGDGVLSILPGDGDLLALTVDDGVSSDVVRAYTQFAKDTGIRLTYFVNGVYRSWTDHADLLRPLVDDGQIQLANHTWSHPDLTKLPLADVAEQLRRNHEFLWKTYGVDARPYFRPPYGATSPHVDKVSNDLGYTVETLWSGTLEDHEWIPPAEVVRMADEHFTPQKIVIGHLNHPPVTEVFGQLIDILEARRLRTVTLDDVFIRPQS